MRNTILSLVMLAAPACAPSINPAMRSATDSMLASIKGSHDEAPPSSYEAIPWSEGQWVVLRSVDKKQQPTIMRMGIVGREAGGFWVEQETMDYYHHTISKTLYSKMPRTPDEAVDALQKTITKKDDEAPQTIDYSASLPALAFTKSLMKSTLQAVVPPNVSASGVTETVSVPGGTFRGCAKVPAKISFGPINVDTIGWYHPAVPITASVKSTSTDGEFTIELLDYGMTGAKSTL